MPHADSDANKCDVGTLTCDLNALCINFSCECDTSRGYVGDGQTCTGERKNFLYFVADVSEDPFFALIESSLHGRVRSVLLRVWRPLEFRVQTQLSPASREDSLALDLDFSMSPDDP